MSTTTLTTHETPRTSTSRITLKRKRDLDEKQSVDEKYKFLWRGTIASQDLPSELKGICFVAHYEKTEVEDPFNPLPNSTVIPHCLTNQTASLSFLKTVLVCKPGQSSLRVDDKMGDVERVQIQLTQETIRVYLDENEEGTVQWFLNKLCSAPDLDDYVPGLRLSWMCDGSPQNYPDLIIYPHTSSSMPGVQLHLSTIKPPRPSRPDAPSFRSTNTFTHYLSCANSRPSLLFSSKYIKRFDSELQNPSFAFPEVVEMPESSELQAKEEQKKRRRTDGPKDTVPSLSPSTAASRVKLKSRRASGTTSRSKRTSGFERSISLPAVPLNDDKQSNLEAQNKLVMKKAVASMVEGRGLKRGTDTFNDVFLQIYKGVQLLAKLETPYSLIPKEKIQQWTEQHLDIYLPLLPVTEMTSQDLSLSISDEDVEISEVFPDQSVLLNSVSSGQDSSELGAIKEESDHDSDNIWF